MSNNGSEMKDSKKGARIRLSVLSFIFFLVTALAVLPVVVPMMFGMNEYVVEIDTTDSISLPYSIIYTDSTTKTSLATNDLIAIDKDDNKKVELYYVASNSIGDQTITLTNNETVAYNQVTGKPYATVPFIGILTQFCSVGWGIAVLAVMFIIGLALAIFAPKFEGKQE